MTWLAGTLCLAAIALLFAARVGRPRLAGAPAWALAALTALTALSWGSLLWSASGGAALEEAERRSLLLVAFALPLLWPPTAGALRAGVAAFCGACLVSGAIGIGAAFADPGTLVDGRLTEPSGYANAQGALLAMGGLAALVLAVGAAGAAKRAVALSLAGVLLAMAALSQSRGILVAVGVTLIVLVAVTRLRAGIALGAATLVVGLALAREPLLDLRPAVLAGDPAPVLARVLLALAGLGVGLALAAALLGPAAKRIGRARTSIPATPAGGPHRRRLAAALVASGAIALGVSITAGPGLASWAEERFDDFRTPRYEELASSEARYTGGLGSNRYAYWRASLEIAGEEPLVGAGAGSFHARYLERRETGPSPRYAHNLWLGTLAELGVVGLALLLVFACALGVALGRACAASCTRDRAFRVAAAAPLLYLGVHASVDWVDAFPALAVPALGLAGAAAIAPARAACAVAGPGRGAAVGVPGPAAGDAPRGQRGNSWAFAGLAVAIALIAMPMLASERVLAGAVHEWRADPHGSLSAIRAAGELNPLSAGPSLAEGVICLRLDRSPCAEEAFAEAAERDPSGWFQQLELGLLARQGGADADAEGHLRRARELNPSEPLVAGALGDWRADRPARPRATALAVLGRGPLSAAPGTPPRAGTRLRSSALSPADDRP